MKWYQIEKKQCHPSTKYGYKYKTHSTGYSFKPGVTLVSKRWGRRGQRWSGTPPDSLFSFIFCLCDFPSVFSRAVMRYSKLQSVLVLQGSVMKGIWEHTQTLTITDRHRSLVHAYSPEHLISPAAITLRTGSRAGAPNTPHLALLFKWTEVVKSTFWSIIGYIYMP